MEYEKEKSATEIDASKIDFDKIDLDESAGDRKSANYSKLSNEMSKINLSWVEGEGGNNLPIPGWFCELDYNYLLKSVKRLEEEKDSLENWYYRWFLIWLATLFGWVNF